MKPLRTATIAAAVALAAPAGAHAQQQTRLEISDASTPTCEQTGVPRVAVMVPPGRTREEIATAVSEGGMFPDGTQIVILNLGEYTPIENRQTFNNRLDGVLRRLLNDGTKIDGTISVLLKVDENGTVTEARPNTGNGSVDRVVGNAWKQAHFAPYTIGGCRMKAWISVPLAFSSDWSIDQRSVRMNVGQQQPPAP